MKKILFLVAICFIAINTQAQDEKKLYTEYGAVYILPIPKLFSEARPVPGVAAIYQLRYELKKTGEHSSVTLSAFPSLGGSYNSQTEGGYTVKSSTFAFYLPVTVDYNIGYHAVVDDYSESHFGAFIGAGFSTNFTAFSVNNNGDKSSGSTLTAGPEVNLGLRTRYWGMQRPTYRLGVQYNVLSNNDLIPYMASFSYFRILFKNKNDPNKRLNKKMNFKEWTR
jgi:hypothetical protein